ncbi:methyl-accepting chemotaxis protein [Bdellovibrio sp. HCB337]|uniref:methyl-accepting chemotaxis protein n=1 Tax=Bdellovibrio sp. HCB337 TaxID=3394358 RepID=UPI0039A6D092
MKKMSIQMQMALPIVFIAFLAMGFSAFLNTKTSRESALQSSESLTEKTAQASANEIRLELEQAFTVARSVAQVESSQKLANITRREDINVALKELLVQNPGLIGTWTGWEANAYDGKDAQYANTPGHDASGRYVPYWSYDKDGKAVLSPLLDYDKPVAGDYYLVPKARQKETMVEPYNYPVNGTMVLMSSAVVPIVMNNQFLGVAGVDFPLLKVRENISKVKPYAESEAYLISSAGNYVAHPKEELITKPASFPVNQTEIMAALKDGKTYSVTGMDQEVSYHYVVVPLNLGRSEQNWGLVVRTPTSAILASANKMTVFQVMVSAVCVLLLAACVFLVSKKIAVEVSRLSGQLRTSADTVTNAIQQLSAAGQALSESSTSSAASLEETVASLEELSSMVKLNSANAQEAAVLSRKSSDSAQQGEHEIKSLMVSMQEITQSSKKIEEIINVIDDIAFQTNLLALNAAVEAARAGEQGKGFAVVADAVRSLAQKSAEAAKDIHALIKESVVKVETGSKKAVESGVVLTSIVESVKKVANLNNEIATASEEQSNGISQISSAMNQLDSSVQSNASSSEEIASTAEEIHNQSVLMENVVTHLNKVVYGEGKKAA